MHVHVHLRTDLRTDLHTDIRTGLRTDLLRSTDTQLQAERRLVKALMAELPPKTLTTILAKASQELLAS